MEILSGTGSLMSDVSDEEDDNGRHVGVEFEIEDDVGFVQASGIPCKVLDPEPRRRKCHLKALRTLPAGSTISDILTD